MTTLIAKYHCPKHGDQGNLIGVSFHYVPGEQTNYCMDCFKELIASHCFELTKVAAEPNNTGGA